MGENLIIDPDVLAVEGPVFGAPHPDQEYWDWLQRRPCRYIPIDITNASKVVITGPCLYKGGSVRDPAATGSALVLRDSLDTNGPRIVAQQLAASGFIYMPTPYWGILCRVGINMAVTPGEARGGLWVVY